MIEVGKLVTHCLRCGGTGKIFNNVPGSVLIKARMMHPMEVVPQPMAEECPSCEGTGHIIYEDAEG